MKRFDVAVVGGGPAGCAAAAAAARLGRTVVLFSSASAEPGIGEGAAPGTAQLIAEIFGDEAKAFTPDAHLRCPSIVSAWGQPEPSVVEHMLNPLGDAWNLDRERFDADLRSGAERLGVDLRSDARLTEARRDAAGWTIAFALPEGGTHSLSARVIVDASGRGARVARRRGARKYHLDRLVALWTVWAAGERDRSASMYIEAVRRGWWYSVLLPRQRRMVVHLTDADLLPADPRERADLAESARRLELIGPALSDVRQVLDRPNVCSARSAWLDRFGGTAWLCAGDAACTFDPLSGRGIVAALLTGRTAGLAADGLLAGSAGEAAVNEHHDALGAMLADALIERKDVYRAEARWPDAEFWSRRHSLTEGTSETQALPEVAEVHAD
ncbi:MAG: FAD-dependent monooxygenase [Actinobacteria bacterium]|nr:FAD-dependent monooxygenase [Actinomycetota bacterium]